MLLLPSVHVKWIGFWPQNWYNPMKEFVLLLRKYWWRSKGLLNWWSSKVDRYRCLSQFVEQSMSFLLGKNFFYAVWKSGIKTATNKTCQCFDPHTEKVTTHISDPIITLLDHQASIYHYCSQPWQYNRSLIFMLIWKPKSKRWNKIYHDLLTWIEKLQSRQWFHCSRYSWHLFSQKKCNFVRLCLIFSSNGAGWTFYSSQMWRLGFPILTFVTSFSWCSVLTTLILTS